MYICTLSVCVCFSFCFSAHSVNISYFSHQFVDNAAVDRMNALIAAPIPAVGEKLSVPVPHLHTDAAIKAWPK